MSEFIKVRNEIQERIFANLNEQQLEAALTVNGPLLILAGAGSGKTTVLIQRIANIILFGDAHESSFEPEYTDEDLEYLKGILRGEHPFDRRAQTLCAVNSCPAFRVLAITFTNKAAGELKDRLVNTLGEEGRQVVAGTFHSFCARFLRQEGMHLGYSQTFTIYDADDSKKLMKQVYKTLNVDEKRFPLRATLGEISRAKDRLCTPEQYEQEVGLDSLKKKIAECYVIYQKMLKEADAMDFDDLLMNAVLLLLNNEEVRTKWQRRFRYIMVDEYQDTNYAQYKLVSILAAQSRNLCVVGDDDQSIYRFRGATIENILQFEDQFTGCRVIRLEQNYRSTGNILDAANQVIAENKNRKGKRLWTNNPRGEKIWNVVVDRENDEGRYIADTILDNVKNGRMYKDHVVLYRANAQSNAIESVLLKSGIPYRIFGGHRFYDSLEIRDAVAYLKLLHNTADNVSLNRVINAPKRGIGDTTMAHVAEIANGLGISQYEVLKTADQYPMLSRASKKIADFVQVIDELKTLSEDEETSIHLLYETVLEKTGYLDFWVSAGASEEDRVQNLRELSSSIQHYEEENGLEASLFGFLEEAALMTDVDNYDVTADAVTLMTMHAAKGLEFPVVFLPGMEENLFPSMQTAFDPEQVEEERRLCYVAITRAREELHLIRAKARMLYGSTSYNMPSRFVEAISPELLIEKDRTSSDSFGFSSGYSRKEKTNTFAFGSDYYGGDWENYAPPRKSKTTAATSFLQDQKIRKEVPDPEVSSVTWTAGDSVRHASFGEGSIEEVRPMGNDQMLTIRFGKETKRLMANYAKLEKIE